MEPIDRIREAAILEFEEKGVRFTMDDVSRRLGISKKTLYERVRDKEQLLETLVEDAWASIKEQESAIVADPSLDPVEKFVRVVTIMPVLGSALDYRKVRDLEAQYPAIKARIEAHLQADWEVTLGLFDEAVRRGLLRPADKEVLREVLFATMERMLSDDFLERTGRGYESAIREALDMLVLGLRADRSPGTDVARNQ